MEYRRTFELRYRPRIVVRASRSSSRATRYLGQTGSIPAPPNPYPTRSSTWHTRTQNAGPATPRSTSDVPTVTPTTIPAIAASVTTLPLPAASSSSSSHFYPPSEPAGLVPGSRLIPQAIHTPPSTSPRDYASNTLPSERHAILEIKRVVALANLVMRIIERLVKTQAGLGLIRDNTQPLRFKLSVDDATVERAINNAWEAEESDGRL